MDGATAVLISVSRGINVRGGETLPPLHPPGSGSYAVTHNSAFPSFAIVLDSSWDLKVPPVFPVTNPGVQRYLVKSQW